jgi:hypothetical protein
MDPVGAVVRLPAWFSGGRLWFVNQLGESSIVGTVRGRDGAVALDWSGFEDFAHVYLPATQAQVDLLDPEFRSDSLRVGLSVISSAVPCE